MEKDQKKKMKNDTEKGTTTLAKLPLEILLDILSRLPAKAIFKYRLVCKSWLSVVRDPYLAKTQLTRASQNENPTIIFRAHIFNYYLLDNIETSNPTVKLRLESKKKGLFFKVVGSCNGLVCVMEDHNFDPFIHIFNPVTREYVKVPKPNCNHQICYSLAVFCYHPLTDEYKILLKVSTEKEIFIYTLGSNLWRKMKDTQLLCKLYKSGVNVNGAIHWLSDHSDMGALFFSIVSFDIGEEEFRLFEHPFELTLESWCELGVLEGCLSLYYCIDPKRAEIWVMKEYGLKESWTKQFVIEKDILKRNMFFVRPLCILNSGEILLEHSGRGFVFYDPKSKMMRNVQIPRFPILGIFGSLVHVRSLVSLQMNSDRVEGQH